MNSEAESKEVQELFFELGYSWNIKGREKDYLNIGSFTHLTTFDKHIGQGFGFVDHKEITLPELRDLVVLKRNDVGDATHENIVTGSKVLQLGVKNYYWQDGKWNEYPCGVDIKQIEKKEMKEYLIPNDSNYVYCQSAGKGQEDWIEIPEGANIITKSSHAVVGDTIFHWKALDSDEFWLKDERVWSNNFGDSLSDYMKENNAVIIWQRNNQTIASAVESVNDKVASAEVARQESKEWDLGDYAFAESDALIAANIEKAKHDHYYIDVSDVDEVDFYEIALRYNVTDPCIQHILKKCLAVGGRGHKDFHTDLKDIYDTASRALKIHKVDQ